MTAAEAEARVARGAALLDEQRPGWWQRIDTQKLDMSSSCVCILGQLEGSYWAAMDTFDLWRGAKANRPSLDCGFNVATTTAGEDYPPLQEAWLHLIAERVAAEADAPIVTWTTRERVTTEA